MKVRHLGSTGVTVSEMGFGAWQLGNAADWGPMSDAEAIRLVREAVDRGCTFFDTAPNYGRGESERLLGTALAGRREEVVLCTKLGTHPDGERSFEVNRLRPSVENSLRKLRTDVLDVVVLHNPPPEIHHRDHPVLSVLRALRAQGDIVAWGYSVDTGAEMLGLLAQTDAQVIEIHFNLLHQEPLVAFEQAYEQGVGLIVKGPLDSGWLSGKYGASSVFTDVRRRWSRATVARRADLIDQLRQRSSNRDLARDALAFVLSHPEVSTVIPGVRSTQQLVANLAASAEPMPLAVRDDLVRWWTEAFSGQDLLPW